MASSNFAILELWVSSCQDTLADNGGGKPPLALMQQDRGLLIAAGEAEAASAHIVELEADLQAKEGLIARLEEDLLATDSSGKEGTSEVAPGLQNGLPFFDTEGMHRNCTSRTDSLTVLEAYVMLYLAAQRFMKHRVKDQDGSLSSSLACRSTKANTSASSRGIENFLFKSCATVHGGWAHQFVSIGHLPYTLKHQ